MSGQLQNQYYRDSQCDILDIKANGQSSGASSPGNHQECITEEERQLCGQAVGAGSLVINTSPQRDLKGCDGDKTGEPLTKEATGNHKEGETNAKRVYDASEWEPVDGVASDPETDVIADVGTGVGESVKEDLIEVNHEADD